MWAWTQPVSIPPWSTDEFLSSCLSFSSWWTGTLVKKKKKKQIPPFLSKSILVSVHHSSKRQTRKAPFRIVHCAHSIWTIQHSTLNGWVSFSFSVILSYTTRVLDCSIICASIQSATNIIIAVTIWLSDIVQFSVTGTVWGAWCTLHAPCPVVGWFLYLLIFIFSQLYQEPVHWI